MRPSQCECCCIFLSHYTLHFTCPTVKKKSLGCHDGERHPSCCCAVGWLLLAVRVVVVVESAGRSAADHSHLFFDRTTGSFTLPSKAFCTTPFLHVLLSSFLPIPYLPPISTRPNPTRILCYDGAIQETTSRSRAALMELVDGLPQGNPPARPVQN